MDKLVVHGGSTLRGSINISGSKNASLPILAATLLTSEDCIIRRVPEVSDTNFDEYELMERSWAGTVPSGLVLSARVD